MNFKEFKRFFGLMLLIFEPFPSPLSCDASKEQMYLIAKEMIEKSEQLMRGKTHHGVYEMTITTPDWERTLSLRYWDDDRKRMLIRIIAPAKEKDVTFLRIKGNMWQYLPRIERVIRIPPSMMMQSWMGSDFTNDDLVKESSLMDDYNHQLLGIKKVGGEEVCEVELVPKPEVPVVWGKIIFEIRKKDYVPLKEKFYNEEGQLKRILTFSEIKRVHDRVIPTLMEMQNLSKSGRKTIIRILEARYNEPIDESIFTLRNLKKANR